MNIFSHTRIHANVCVYWENDIFFIFLYNVFIYSYKFKEFSKHRENKHPSGTPTYEPLKCLVNSPEIPLPIHKKKKRNKEGRSIQLSPVLRRMKKMNMTQSYNRKTEHLLQRNKQILMTTWRLSFCVEWCMQIMLDFESSWERERERERETYLIWGSLFTWGVHIFIFFFIKFSWGNAVCFSILQHSGLSLTALFSVKNGWFIFCAEPQENICWLFQYIMTRLW